MNKKGFICLCKANKRGTSFVSLYQKRSEGEAIENRRDNPVSAVYPPDSSLSLRMTEHGGLLKNKGDEKEILNNVQSTQNPDASCFRMTMKRVAFTLSEVLITLSILGVIAAVTIPGIVHHFKKAQTETGFKIAYSMLEKVIGIAKAENGGLKNMIPVSSTSMSELITTFATNYLVPYLNISAACGYYNGTAWNNGLTSSCPKPKGGRYRKGVDGTTNAVDLNYTYTIMLKNGMYLHVYSNNYNQGLNEIIMWVDINGDKGKNQVGWDIFSFSVWRPFTGTHCEPRNNGHYDYCNYSDELFAGHGNSYQREIRDVSNPTCSGNGQYCSTVIYRNGFKIPDNYPVKNF